MAAKAVTIIQPTATRFPFAVPTAPQKRRVAGYARVSTNEEEQLNSYEAQVNYYTNHIQENSEWEFVEVYTDEGISATSTKKRDGFNRMIEDALAGKIDLILTKSVSRFARNTVDTLTTVRALKEKGVEVYFEKENIYTLDSKGELLITIMSSLAQEESRSISENVTWGLRKRFADGKVSLPYKNFLGYEKGEDGLPHIVESEAEIIRTIYRLFLYGKAPSAIATYLTSHGIPTPSGKAKWRPNCVESILTNEKYKGDAILQKTFCVDFLTKKFKPNEGEVPQYYVKNSHEAIIPPELFDLVQYEYKKRRASGHWTSSAHCFSGKIICGECGGLYGTKVWHSNDQYRRVIWQCNKKYESRTYHCTTPHLTDGEIKTAFLAAINRVLKCRADIMDAYDEIIEALANTAALDAESAELHRECDVVVELIRKSMAENAQVTLDQTEYQQRYENYTSRYEAARGRLAEIDELRIERTAKRTNIQRFMDTIRAQDKLITEFDEALWYATVAEVRVFPDRRIVFLFYDGTKIQLDENMWRAA